MLGGPISLPLWRQKERDYVSEKKRTVERVMNDTYRPKAKPGRVSRRGNVTPASSGRVDGPADCGARRGPDGVRGVVDFCDHAKIHDSPGLPTGDITSRRTACRRRRVPKHCKIRPTSRISLDYHGNGPAGKTFIFPSANSSRLMKTIRSEPVADVLPWYTQ